MAEGKKFDQNKLRVDLMPVVGLFQQADVYTRGAKKYDPHNWRKGIEWSRILGAMFRHMLWFAAGESHDSQDGQHHLSSVSWCANTLMEFEITHPELDDRYIPFSPDILHEILDKLERGEKGASKDTAMSLQAEMAKPDVVYLNDTYCEVCHDLNGNHLAGICTTCENTGGPCSHKRKQKEAIDRCASCKHPLFNHSKEVCLDCDESHNICATVAEKE